MAIGFIGLGNIGGPIARHLLKLQEPVLVHDAVPAAAQDFTALGARVAASVAEMAPGCRMIGLCVRDDADVESLLYGAQGLLALMPRDAVIAVHSTVTQAALLRWVGDAHSAGIHLLDAPISGGAAGAAAGTLVYMVGGETALFERCKPVFETSGSQIIHAGASGAGLALKLCNNLMTYAAFAAIDEAVALARACGLAPSLLAEVGRGNGVVTAQMLAFLGNRDALAAQGADHLAAAFAPFAALGRKDLQAALASAAALGLTLPVTHSVAARIEDVFLARLAARPGQAQ